MDQDPTAERRGTAVLWGVSALATAVVLGPGLRSGIVVSYDLAWPASAHLTPFALGVGIPAPRAVPSDALAVVLGRVVGPVLAQKVVLVAILMVAAVATGRLARHLMPSLPTGALIAAAVAAIWNPFVEERLVIGQWTVLAGYAAIPLLLRVALEVRERRRPGWLLAAGVALCGLGGANTVVMVVLALLPLALVSWPHWRTAVCVLGAAAASAAVWAVPALTYGVRSGGSAAGAFGPRADTPLGVLGSLVSGGAVWNTAAHPAARESWLVALVALVWAAAAALSLLVVRVRRRDVGLLALLLSGSGGLGVCLLSVADPGGVWTWIVTTVPGGGLLRDSQKLLAPWVVVLAVGSARLVQVGWSRRAVGGALAVSIALLPVALSPGLVWGVGGRVAAVHVPVDLLQTSAWLSNQPERVIGLLPWSQYRRYLWNDHRVSLTLVPRLVDQRILYDDSLPLTTGSIPGEDPIATSVSQAITAGARPLDALATAGVRRVVVERAPGQSLDDVLGAPLAGWTVTRDSPTVVVLDRSGLGPTGGRGPLDAGRMPTGALAVGWFVTVVTIAVAGLSVLGRAIARKGRTRAAHLLRSAP